MKIKIAQFEVNSAEIPHIWKAADKYPGRYALNRVCLIVHGRADDANVVGSAELAATDGRQMARFTISKEVDIFERDAVVPLTGDARAILVDAKTLSTSLKGKGVAAFTLYWDEAANTYALTIDKSGAIFKVPCEPHDANERFHGARFPDIDAVTPPKDRPYAEVTLNRDLIKKVIDSSSLRGDAITLKVSTEENVSGSPVAFEVRVGTNHTIRSSAVLMPVRLG